MASEILLRQQLDTRMSAMRSDRLSWWAHWAQLAEYFLPRRYKWFVSPNQANRGSQMNQNIIDETGLIAIRTLASGMLSGLTSPTRPWFKLGFRNKSVTQFGPVKLWLAACETAMYRIFAGSNFYQAMGVAYHDQALFASAALICYEDDRDVVRFYNPCLGEFFFAVDNRLVVDTLYREFTYTVQQTVDEFTLEKCSESVKQSYKSGGASLNREVVICHAIEPNTQVWQDGTSSAGFAVPKKFRYREIYWEQGSSQDLILRKSGYNEKPFIGLRWNVVSNDPYGSDSPGMNSLPAVRQLQVEQRRKGEVIDKMVRPPMNAPVSMRNEPSSILPGAVNYVSDVSQAGFKPAFLVDARGVAEIKEDIKEVQERVNQICYVDLFMMISQLETVRTATEIDARREEKLIQLGPVIERSENEGLDVIIDRVFQIAIRRGLIPPAPKEIQGQTLEVSYVSMLAEAQRAASTSAIERLFGLVGSIAGIYVSVTDNVDWDEGIDQYADDLGVPPKLIRSAAAVAQIREQRSKQQAAQVAAEQTLPIAQGAKTLSETKVGQGQNALSMMLGNA